MMLARGRLVPIFGGLAAHPRQIARKAHDAEGRDHPGGNGRLRRHRSCWTGSTPSSPPGNPILARARVLIQTFHDESVNLGQHVIRTGGRVRLSSPHTAGTRVTSKAAMEGWWA
jgi:hypothetical protein